MVDDRKTGNSDDTSKMMNKRKMEGKENMEEEVKM